jgi:putative membrane protein
VGYLLLKALHIIAVISWMAGMLYLPRLFVYHAGVVAGSSEASLFETMEYRLLRYIMTPALVVVWITGVSLAVWAGFFTSPWLQAKLLLVVLMSGIHGYLARCRRDLADGTSQRAPRFFRIINEVPTVLMIGIVVLVVVKPWS